jgi:Signal transduction histidine kinase
MRNAVEHGGESVAVTVGMLDDETGFYLADDGPGIPDGERDQLFESGYSTTDDGTGLGLAIVRQIVEAHNWEIRVCESADGGTRFEISGVETVV